MCRGCPECAWGVLNVQDVPCPECAGGVLNVQYVLNVQGVS